MSANTNLNRALKAKNDEFYTQYEDIEKEVSNYTEHLKGKAVFCNCDDPEQSNFWKYFKDNFERLELKQLISTHYEKGTSSYKLEFDGKEIKRTALSGDGDFRSEECIEILKESDIVITNPPFSLFREYVAQLIEYKKQFLIIGNLNAITYKELFPYLKSNKIWIGNNSVKEFVRPDGTLQKFGNICWFTNLDTDKRHSRLNLTKHYTKKEYPKFDNYRAINVNRVIDIPYDYEGVMGVPITFMTKYNPEQFEVLGLSESEGKGASGGLWDEESGIAHSVVNGKKLYARIFIKVK